MAAYFTQNNARVILDFGFTKNMALEKVREFHDYALETQRRFPEVIFGNWLQIDPGTGREGAAEFKRCIEASSGFVGICISAAGMGFPASDPIYRPFYEVAISAGRPVLVLVGYTGAGAGIPGGKSNLHANSVVALRTYKKEIYDKTGGYDESVEFAEDIDLILKLEERTKLFFINEPLYFYRILSQSQSHSFLNTRLNRASTALAKLNAYERRLGTNLPNLNKSEISEALFFGIINSVLGVRLSLAMKFIQKQLKINPLFFLDSRFYSAVIKKVKKINQLKKEKPLLGV